MLLNASTPVRNSFTQPERIGTQTDILGESPLWDDHRLLVALPQQNVLFDFCRWLGDSSLTQITLGALCITRDSIKNVLKEYYFFYEIHIIKQATLNLHLSAKKTRKQVFLDQMDQVVSWVALVELIAPYYPEGRPVPPHARFFCDAGSQSA